MRVSLHWVGFLLVVVIIGGLSGCGGGGKSGSRTIDPYEEVIAPDPNDPFVGTWTRVGGDATLIIRPNRAMTIRSVDGYGKRFVGSGTLSNANYMTIEAQDSVGEKFTVWARLYRSAEHLVPDGWYQQYEGQGTITEFGGLYFIRKLPGS